MGTTYQRLIEKGRAIGRAEGIAEARVEAFVKQLAKAAKESRTLDELIDKTKLSKEEIKEICDILSNLFANDQQNQVTTLPPKDGELPSL